MTHRNVFHLDPSCPWSVLAGALAALIFSTLRELSENSLGLLPSQLPLIYYLQIHRNNSGNVVIPRPNSNKCCAFSWSSFSLKISTVSTWIFIYLFCFMNQLYW